MNSLYNLIITTGNRYNNSVEVEGKELIINTEVTERDAEFVNRVGTVVGTPLAIDIPIEKGDEVIVHHNVFRRWYDVRGVEKNGGAYINEELYKIEVDQVFAYRKPNESWKATPGYCFVVPIEEREDTWDISSELKLKGVVKYIPEKFKHLKGHVVGFVPFNEYEFRIDGERLYRIYLNEICIDYGPEKREGQNTCECEDCTCSVG